MAPAIWSMLFGYFLFLACLCFSVIFSAPFAAAVAGENAVLNEEQTAHLRRVYYDALAALKSDDLRTLERLLETRGGEIQAALDFELVDESLLYSAIFHLGVPYRKHRILARYGIEMDGSKAYRRWFYRASPSFYLIPRPEVFEDVVELGLLKWEDLWVNVMDLASLKFFALLKNRGADTEYRIPLSDHGDYISVLGKCVAHKNLELLNELLQAEVNLNAAPTPNHVNIWQMIVASKGQGAFFAETSSVTGRKVSQYLPIIAERTENLLSPFADRRLIAVTDAEIGLNEEIDRIISAELSKRTVDLHQFDRVDELGWTLLDRVCLLMPGSYPLTARILLDAGLSTRFPLTTAYYAKDWLKLRALIDSGIVDYNEQAQDSVTILSLLISDDRVDESFIEMLIDHGADVNFPSEAKASNAYICALRTWKRDPLSDRLISKIEAKLTPEEAQKTEAYLKQMRKRKSIWS